MVRWMVHATMQRFSKALACCKRLKKKLRIQGGRPTSLWDPAYPLRPHLMALYRIGQVPVFTDDVEAFNAAMSSVRASVEWLLGDISNSFKFLDFKKHLKLGLSAVGKQYIVSALFRNILICLYSPPTVQDYLA